MSRVTRMFGRVGFGAMVVGALAFGATQALATTRQRECSLCDYPDLQGFCNTCCVVVLGMDGGDCWPSGNCLCY
jgi:hypothetical protein